MVFAAMVIDCVWPPSVFAHIVFKNAWFRRLMLQVYHDTAEWIWRLFKQRSNWRLVNQTSNCEKATGQYGELINSVVIWIIKGGGSWTRWPGTPLTLLQNAVWTGCANRFIVNRFIVNRFIVNRFIVNRCTETVQRWREGLRYWVKGLMG